MAQEYRWADIAHAVNGYEICGGLHACADRARAVRERLRAGEPLAEIETLELQLWLFFEARADRHAGDYRTDYSEPKAVVAELLRRHGEAWMEQQLRNMREWMDRAQPRG